MDLGIAGLRVLVTAGAAGIGRGIVEAFLEEGARVFACDVDSEALAGLPDAVGRIRTDVADRDGVATMMDRAVEFLGGIDVLINNAGIAGPTGRVEEIAPEEWDRCLTVCLTSQFNCARLAVPHLRQSPNASIVNLSSAAGKFGFALRSPYAAAKWGGHRLHQVFGDRTRRVRHPGECDPAGLGGRRPAAPGARIEGPAAGHELRRDGSPRLLVRFGQGLRHRPAARRPDPAALLAPRPDHLGSGHFHRR